MSAKLGSASLSEPCYWILSRTKLYIPGKNTRAIPGKYLPRSEKVPKDARYISGKYLEEIPFKN